MSSLVDNGPVVLRSRWKYERFTTTTTTTENGQILIRKAVLSIRLRWTKRYTYMYVPYFQRTCYFLGRGDFSGTNKDNLSFDVAYWSTYVNTNDCLCGRSEQLYGSCFSGTSNCSFCLECDRPDQLGWRIIGIWVFKVSEDQQRLKVSETIRKLFNHCRFICNICWKRKLNVSLPELSDDFFPHLVVCDRNNCRRLA